MEVDGRRRTLWRPKRNYESEHVLIFCDGIQAHWNLNYTVHVRSDILSERDGPMLEHGIKEMNKGKLWVPPAPGEKPDPARIEVRFKEFSDQ